MWGWQTGTGARLTIIVDAWGRGGRPSIERKATGDSKESKILIGRVVQDADVKPVGGSKAGAIESCY